jgi:DNA repair exonuclease SbcCD nuclease subunit
MKNIAVLISDIHFNVNTLNLAYEVTLQAVKKANQLEIPLIVAGDLHDTKANLRAECIEKMLDVFSKCNELIYFLRGNHDSINEKSKEHALVFLESQGSVIKNNTVIRVNGKDLYLIPYEHDVEVLKEHLKTIPKGSTLIMHQGVKSADSGDYIQDKSAIDIELLKDFRCISGHYHNRQNIENFSYLGNPYTLTFGEANDRKKGFSVLKEDGKLQFIPTNLREHYIFHCEMLDNGNWQITGKKPIEDVTSKDLVRCKFIAKKAILQNLTKEQMYDILEIPNTTFLKAEFEQIPEINSDVKLDISKTNNELLDYLIDELNKENSDDLKNLWRNIYEND